MDPLKIEELLSLLRSLKDQMSDGQPNLPNDLPATAHLASIPKKQRSMALLMTPVPPTMPVMPTVFIGNILQNYTADMWQKDVRKWKTYFQDLQLEQPYEEIKLFPLSEMPQVMDSSDAIPKIERFLLIINQLPADQMIRIICMGTAHSAFLFDAITYLLKEWREPKGELRRIKHMQFITSGDSRKRNLSDFCQWLCISGTCQAISFYNTHMYHPFGYCRAQYKP